MAGQEGVRIFRDGWLDFLRACAIASVVAYHLLQMSPGARLGWEIARHGHLGVDLFFVLSGWLIGGLYFREQKRFGNVSLCLFWLRRWLRTIPAYWVALICSWLSVYAVRREGFDWGYLFFIQNFYERIPYFLVSWSLCVEEHFYVVVPLLVYLAARVRVSRHVLFAGLFLSGLFLRVQCAEAAPDASFGFYQTASILRFDGLVLGFWAGALSLDSNQLDRARRWARRCLPVLATAFLWTLLVARSTQTYVLLPAVSGLLFLALLLAGHGLRGRETGAIYWAANTAYSVYLTHALVIHFARLGASKIGGGALGYYAIAAGLIPLSGVVFFVLVERRALRLRDRWAPSRKGGTSARSDDVGGTRGITDADSNRAA